MSTVVVATVKSNSSSPPAFQNTSGTEIGTLCRAWVNFDGSGVVAIRAQFNVSSITDNGTGDYTVNFTNALADANYSFVATSSGQSGVRSWHTPSVDTVTTPTASLVRIGCVNTSSAREDDPYIFVTVHR